MERVSLELGKKNPIFLPKFFFVKKIQKNDFFAINGKFGTYDRKPYDRGLVNILCGVQILCSRKESSTW